MPFHESGLLLWAPELKELNPMALAIYGLRVCTLAGLIAFCQHQNLVSGIGPWDRFFPRAAVNSTASTAQSQTR
jgi:hypothetical protein